MASRDGSNGTALYECAAMTDPDAERSDKMFGLLMAGLCVLSMVPVLVMVWVVAHFVRKYW